MHEKVGRRLARVLGIIDTQCERIGPVLSTVCMVRPYGKEKLKVLRGKGHARQEEVDRA